MFKKINNHHLSLLIIIVFILNTILFQTIKMSKAQWWTPPSGAPGEETSNILTSPLSADLDLGGNNIIGDGNIDINARGYFSGLGIGVNELETYQALHIKKEDSAYVGLKLENTLGSSILSIKTPANTAEAIVTFNNGSNNWQIGMDNNPTDVRGDFGIGTTNNENPQFLIQADGNVGIGTNGPGYKLEVADEMNIYGSSDTDYRIEGRRSLGDYPGWDPDMLYINAWNDWTSGATVAGSGGLHVDGYLNIKGDIKLSGNACNNDEIIIKRDNNWICENFNIETQDWYDVMPYDCTGSTLDEYFYYSGTEEWCFCTPAGWDCDYSFPEPGDDEKIIFVTSNEYEGDLTSYNPFASNNNIDGIAGANFICQDLADYAEQDVFHNRTFKAWVSGPAIDGKPLINAINNTECSDTKSYVMYKDTDSDGQLEKVTLFNNCTELLTNHDVEVKWTENITVASDYMRTGTEDNGSLADHNCERFTSSSSSITTGRGNYSTGSDGFKSKVPQTSSSTGRCNKTYHLFCLEI